MIKLIDLLVEIGVDLSNYKGQILKGDVIRAPKGFPLGGEKLDKSLSLKVIKISREGVNRYKLSLEDTKTGKKYTVRNYQMDGEYKGKKLPKRQPIETYLVENRLVQSNNLKKRLINEGLKQHKCECCGITEWNGKITPIELDHIDGNRYNNTLENLRLLCPNCHAQTETYRGKNKKS